MTGLKRGHVEAGGVRYGYEIHGTGMPLLLLHGGFGSLWQGDAGWDGSKMARHRLAILPGITHYSMSDAPLLAETALAFLDCP